MTRTRSMVAIGAALAIILAGGGFLYLRGGSTPVGVDQAVGAFRGAGSNASPTPTPAGGPSGARAHTTSVSSHALRTHGAPPTTKAVSVRPLPPEGVYIYATTGHDEVDVLGGSRHDYPSTTTVTVRHAGCGLTERWDVLKERWDERETCRTPGGDTLKRFTSYHDFFRHSDLRTYDCTGFAYPKGAKPGDTWHGRCQSGKSMVEQTGRAVAIENVDVGGRIIRALRVRVDVKLSSEQVGSGYREVWGALDSGLSLHERGETSSASQQPVFGTTHYHELFEISLESLKPRT